MTSLTVTDASKCVETAPPTTKFVSATEIAKESQYRESFTENPNQVLDVNEYSRGGTDPGLVVIFNQVNFENHLETRYGSNRDVNELIIMFGRLGFNVDRRYLYSDKTRKEIEAIVAGIAKEDHTQRNCLIVVVLTHGDKDNLLYARDTCFQTSNIWEPFYYHNCPTLKGKPKFFVFQACKGGSSSQVGISDSEIISKEFFRGTLEPDFLVAFSAVEGNRSYRHVFNGTWFIQEMCRNFSAFGRRDDVITLLLRTNKCVASNYYYTFMDEEKRTVTTKQMPLFLSTLRKKFYLTKSKDRNLALTYLRRQKKITETLEELKVKVDSLYKDYEARKKQRKSKASSLV